MSEPVLQAKRVCGGYGDLQVVHGVSVDVTPGRITALMGRNGAGKTTVLRMLSGLSATRSGSIRLDGDTVTDHPAHLRVKAGLAYVQEGKRVFRERTVEENLFLGTFAQKMAKRERTRLVEEAYERFPALKAKRSSRLAP